MWRAIRYGLSGELLDFERGEPIAGTAPARAARSNGSPRSPTRSAQPRTSQIPERNAAERQIQRSDEGASLREIYAEQVKAGEPIA